VATTSYTLGDDVVSHVESHDVFSQERTYDPVRYLLHDGHGSTRQVLGPAQDIVDCFSYDAYGVMLGGNPTNAAPPVTNLLYAGEQFDTDLQQYYLRARFYDQNNGRFNGMDPFAGSTQEPQSLHKYSYAHDNPVNGIDPTGTSFILNVTISTVIRGAIAAMTFGTISTVAAKVRGATWGQALWAGLRTAGITGFAFVSPLMACSLAAISPVVVGLGLYSGDITGEDVPEIAAYVAAGIALMLLFKSPQFKVWEVKTALNVKLPKAIRNLQASHSIRAGRNYKWEIATRTGNKAAQGSLIHAELADLMRAEGMTNLGIEVSYDAAGNLVSYGTKGSVRLDYAIYQKGEVVKVIELKPNDVINASWLSKASQYIKLSAEDFEAISYGGK